MAKSAVKYFGIRKRVVKFQEHIKILEVRTTVDTNGVVKVGDVEIKIKNGKVVEE